MQAAIYESFGGPIRVHDNVPIPPVPPDGVLIAVMATGVCRSDWHGWKGRDSDIVHHGLPFCPGHEFSGVVVQLGQELLLQVANHNHNNNSTNQSSSTTSTTDDDGDPNNDDHDHYQIQVGDRVAVPFILSCGHCRYCHDEKQPTICAHQLQPGFTQWGSFAEYVAVPRAQRHLRKLPATVSFVQAAALGCRFTTAYRALYQQGQWLSVDNNNNQQSTGSGGPPKSVAILGCGGLGLSCIMLAAAAAATTTTTTTIAPTTTSATPPHPTTTTTTPKRMIVAVDVSYQALQKAQTLGATHWIQVRPNQSSDDIAKEILQISQDGDGMDLTLETAGLAVTSAAAVLATRPGGRMVQVGLPPRTPSIPMSRVAGKELAILGSHGFDSAKALPNLLQLVANKTVDPCRLVEAQVSLEQGCRALEDMDHQSPLGIVMITNFNSTTTSTTRTKSGNPRL